MAEIALTDQNFEKEVLDSDLPVLVDFYGEWCQPCKLLAPIISQVAKDLDGRVKIGKLDVDKNPQTAQKYGVMGIPTMIFFKDGKEVKRIVGLRNKENLINELELT
ncbi:thioredoxin [Candidatus Shapirobacteria bacterium CG10_big_fil_rev_8_21_14_0_10_38_14]|uniref:Thioredoxin n=1 Tax=Candidatus Shapirobacteria bacterium CG10_big_fil_rev_8_21_14_0_10_38_14 TaxID=1974483 RepID=A0A2M8L5W0_9BACT|nr:MAG: thioredoxin [Candidatus Shapirobacteria bacterium CG10_big_fil_rev_8_21_14_0_10_38_14]